MNSYRRYDWLSLAILGVCVGHPAIERFDTPRARKLEALDAAFDESAYIRGWIEWSDTPSLPDADATDSE